MCCPFCPGLRLYDMERQSKETERITDLFLRELTGNLGAKEKEELEAWKHADPIHEEVGRSLSDPAHLQEEYRKWRSVSSSQAREAMRLRLKTHKRGWRIWLWPAGAAALLLLLVAALLALQRSEHRYDDLFATYQTQQYMSTIHPGQTKARLTTDDGKVVVLGNNEANNDEALRAVEAAAVKLRRQKEQIDRMALNKLEIPRGGEFHITLEDGTEVWLNAESSLRYPDHFGENGREVELSGEAYFKVFRDEARPFRVRIDGQQILVQGTEFNVMSYAEDQYVYTTLVSGRISIRPDNASPSELILTPGHQAVFAKADNSTFVQQVNTEVVTSWKSGMFVFENQTLDQIMRQLSRWYDFSYVFSDESLPTTVFMGRVPRYGTFGDVLDILERSGDLHFSIDGNRILISRK